MKKGLLLLSFLLLVTIGFSQTTNNEKRLSVIEAEIKAAAQAENYELAAKLKNEQKLRLQIKEAIANQDFDEAERLKNEINGVTTEETPIKSNSVEETVIETQTKGNPNNQTSNSYSRINKSTSTYVLFAPISYSRWDIYDENAYALSFKLGNKFYFNSKSASKWKFGLEMEWFNPTIMTDGDIYLAVSFLKPGFGTTCYINDNMGIDIGVNFGPQLFLYEFVDLEDIGLDATIHTEFFYKKFAVGFNLQNFTGFYDYEYRNLTLGFTLGWRL
jgi:hypothetical protein